MLKTFRFPSVRVPVLSNAINSIFFAISINLFPLTSIPSFANFVSAAILAKGVDNVRAQGQDTTNKIKPR